MQQVQLRCRAVRNFQEQSQPIAFTPQRYCLQMPLNCNSCNVARVLDQLQIERVRIMHLTIKDGKRAEHLTSAGEQGARPNGANTVRCDEVTIVVPNRLAENVGYIHRLPAINGCAAGCSFRAHAHAPYIRGEAWKTGSGCAMEM